MSLQHKYRTAGKRIRSLSPEQLHAVTRVCSEIRLAQESLCRTALENLTRCYRACEGICCRNIVADTIISHWDFVYILVTAPDAAPMMEACLKRENRLFAADCIFLADGVGPCRFPHGVRPEVCITSFCTETPRLDREIRQVKRAFFRLTWTVTRFRLQGMAGRIRDLFPARPPRDPVPSGPHSPPGPIRVTAAVIRRKEGHEDQVLIARRSGGHLDGKWEFPGGKIEPGETPEACLCREIMEELGIGIRITGYLMETRHAYPEKEVCLLVYEAVTAGGDMSPTVHDGLRWIRVDRLETMDMAPADIPVCRRLMAPSSTPRNREESRG